MAVSEPIVTLLSSASDPRRGPRPLRRADAERSAWPQILMDIVTISAALALTPVVLGENLKASLGIYGRLSPVAVAMMVTTVFAFSGAYPRYRSVLDIGDVEGT